MAGSPQLFTLLAIPGKRCNCFAMSFDDSLGTGLLLNISGDGRYIYAAKYSHEESIGVSVLVVISCLSLVAVLGLLFLTGVRINFSTSLGVYTYERGFLHRRFLRGPIGPLRTRTTSSEPMSLYTSSVSCLPISFKA